METNPGPVTELLKAMGQGDEKAADALPALDFQRIWGRFLLEPQTSLGTAIFRRSARCQLGQSSRIVSIDNVSALCYFYIAASQTIRTSNRSSAPRALSRNARHSSIHVAIKVCLGKVQCLSGICRSQRDANAFEGGLITLGSNAADGHQNISLRIVRRGAPTSDLVWDYREARRLANFTFKVTIDVHDLTGAQIPFFHVERVQKEDAPTIKYTPVSVIQSVDSGVELIVAANGRQQKFVGLKVMFRDRANG
jgi:hypothetical protein